MIDTEKFIKCVKNHPTIWKKTAKGYGDKISREKSWNMIGHQMFHLWDKMTETEKLDEVRNMKNKWRHMRDSFNKYINQGKGRFPAVRKKRYVYADNLSFLLQRGSRPVPKGLEAIEEEAKQSSVEVEEESTQNVEEREEPHVSFKKPGSRLSSTRNFANKQQQFVKKNVGQTRIEDDPDRCYLLSLLPEFRKLNDDEKLDFRFHTLQFFRVIRTKRSVSASRSTDFENGWNENMECQPDNSSERDIPQVFIASPCHSPRVSQDSSFPNSPQDSIRSDHSTSAYMKHSPPIAMKSEII